MEFPIDKNGKKYEIGSLFIENYVGDVIWNGKAKIIDPPVGIFIGDYGREAAFSGWTVATYKVGKIISNEEEGDLYINRWDGEYTGDFSETEII